MWAVAGDPDSADIRSNTFEMEWPPPSGKLRIYLELERAEWLNTPAARVNILGGQAIFLQRLSAVLDPRTE
ncbi:putative NUDIX family NTP pyrophosphohydrolase [Bradyrhizobium sp. USDA 4524]|uniref:hypothetical protein n=1 Tax=unclassified Bradyrhizobium TaxID=2631580 RepID=UPI0020A19FD6|nr:MULTISPECIES: hypothetical protein [unclassified Bradyrhizobium]MCP1838375.1 putative NUDIX family NTP pyrophosphohydrolase [Bradyrhizobium sp. USDA 4538]MCP1898939.1 putative NUDIX family NTP pyrophosphohydrolase [Bradyrhizobium sp. USDA 4537]MCP1986947.1 putative NUDIX family NTP pyrophosphohydrolase [Bradyrhizobium sp. USDA 4539]